MAEDIEVKKKKLPIVPILMVMMLVLLGGGYFMMKGKGDKPGGKVEIALAEKDTDLEEFLTNTKNPSVYVRAKMTIRLRKDYDEAKIKDNLGDVRDAVINVFNGLSSEDITDPARRPLLKRTIAEAINSALEGPVVKAAAPKQKPKPKALRTGKLESLKEDPETEPAAVEPVNDWDSETGPVLKVRFMSLATQ